MALLSAQGKYRAGVYSDHKGTRLPNGKPALLIDSGSKGNISGPSFVRSQAKAAMQSGKAQCQPTQKKRDKPLRVGGIGSGSPTADCDCTLPISLRQTNGALTKGTFTTPTLEASSDIPGLLGLEALMAENAVIDFANLKVYLCGPGGAEISPGSGAREYQGVLSPSGHLMLP